MCLLQEEDELRAKEEQEKREEEEYLKLKAAFVIEDQGEAEILNEDEVSSSLLLSDHVAVVHLQPQYAHSSY